MSGYNRVNQAVNSEYMKLKEVLLYFPKSGIVIPQDDKLLILDSIDTTKILKELQNLARLYEEYGIKVNLLPLPSNHEYNANLINMIYVRDLFFMTPWGAIIGNMGVPIRKAEIVYVNNLFNKIKIPILKYIDGDGTFEGADALWLSNNIVIIGVGNRTNFQGFAQLKEALEQFGVRVILCPFNLSHPQHLLGILQVIDKDLIFVRGNYLDITIRNKLVEMGYKLVVLDENNEILNKQAMNIVVLSPRNILMPKHCYLTLEKFKEHNVTVNLIEIEEIIKGCGGIACITGIMSREITMSLSSKIV